MKIVIRLFFFISIACMITSFTYVDDIKCKHSTAKVRSIVKSNWRKIQKKANFTVSDKKDFDISHYRMDGDDLEVKIYSRGFWYDISFTVSFDEEFDEDCNLSGRVLDVYNYKKH